MMAALSDSLEALAGSTRLGAWRDAARRADELLVQVDAAYAWLELPRPPRAFTAELRAALGVARNVAFVIRRLDEQGRVPQLEAAAAALLDQARQHLMLARRLTNET